MIKSASYVAFVIKLFVFALLLFSVEIENACVDISPWFLKPFYTVSSVLFGCVVFLFVNLYCETAIHKVSKARAHTLWKYSGQVKLSLKQVSFLLHILFRHTMTMC